MTGACSMALAVRAALTYQEAGLERRHQHLRCYQTRDNVRRGPGLGWALLAAAMTLCVSVEMLAGRNELWIGFFRFREYPIRR
ncbi:hypothetical protein, partial [Mycobacterium marinum]|uniref:hypothetical protein n=1 Tax=Mycobacterium marinum TaxID=1781 RepID=UPI0021C2E610